MIFRWDNVIVHELEPQPQTSMCGDSLAVYADLLQQEVHLNTTVKIASD